MRKYHRWITVFFGVFLLAIAVTGVVMQVLPLFAGDDDGPHHPPVSAPGGGQVLSLGEGKGTFVCPPEIFCRPKPKAGDPRALKGFIQHLHSGEAFGPAGVVIVTLAGLGMVFFSISGLWMYLQMWRNRKQRGLTPRWFWK